CRWLTVMASGSEVLPIDLPSELLSERIASHFDNDISWQKLLETWAKSALPSGETEFLAYALPEFERILLEAARHHT
ncbi:nitrogen regulation protein NR(I), partial [Vibrio cholerae]